MKPLMSYIVILLIGIGAGIGVGAIMDNPKLAQKQDELNELQTQFDNLQKEKDAEKAESEKTVGLAIQDITRYKSDNLRLNQSLLKLNRDLVTTKTELSNLKARLRTEAEGPVVAEGFPQQPKRTVLPPAASEEKPALNTVEYVVQEGDSLWKIAQEQLDNGARYNEIMNLNPGVDEKTVLHQGMKLKLPKQ